MDKSDIFAYTLAAIAVVCTIVAAIGYFTAASAWGFWFVPVIVCLMALDEAT